MKSGIFASVALASVSILGSNVVTAQEELSFRMMGLPLAAGNIQKNREQPFFVNFEEKTGLPISIDYLTLEQTGIKPFEQLRVMKSGIFDLALLRMAQNSRDEPVILGLDLVGLNDSFETAQKVVAAYKDIVSERLEEQFNVKLLGVWAFGPQIIFCKQPVESLADLEGLKVRVYDGIMARFMERVDAIPVTMATSEVSQALALGTIDCGVTGPSTANSAGWPEYVTHVYPLALQAAMQGYAIRLDAWNELNPEQQQELQNAIDRLVGDIWAYSEELYDDAMRCNAGEDPCETGRKYDLTTSTVKPEDAALVKAAVREIAFPAWQSTCDASAPGCSEAWLEAVGPIVGME